MPSGKDVSVMAEKPTIYVKPSEKLLENSQKSVLQTLKTKLLENPPVKVAKNSLIPTEESIKMQLLKNLQSKLPELIPITDDISIAAPDISDNNNIPIEGCSEDIIEIKKEVKSEVPLEDDTPLVIDTHDDIEEGPVDLSAKFKSVAVQTEHSLNQLLALRLRQILLEISLEVVASNQRDTVKDRLNKSLLLFLESLEQIQQTQQVARDKVFFVDCKNSLKSLF